MKTSNKGSITERGADLHKKTKTYPNFSVSNTQTFLVKMKITEDLIIEAYFPMVTAS